MVYTQKDLVPFHQLTAQEQEIARERLREHPCEELEYVRTHKYGLCFGTYDEFTGMMNVTPLEHDFQCACCRKQVRYPRH